MKHSFRQFKEIVAGVSALFFACITATPAYAAMTYVLCSVLNLVQGDIGSGVATLGVMAVGIGAILGKVSMGMAVTVCVGIAILFGAASIAGMLGISSSC